MSKRHIIILKRSYGRKVADKEEIWKNVKEVWDQYPSPTIARGYSILYRIMNKSLAIDIGNNYLCNRLNSNVIRDFINTNDSVVLVEYI